MMRPPPCRFMWGIASRDMRAKNSKDRCSAVAHCSSVALRARARGGPPELLTRMSRASESTGGGGDQVSDRLVIVEITRQGQDVGARRLTYLLRRAVQVGLGTAAHDDPGPFFRQHLRAGAPQALAGSAHHGHLVLEL